MFWLGIACMRSCELALVIGIGFYVRGLIYTEGLIDWHLVSGLSCYAIAGLGMAWLGLESLPFGNGLDGIGIPIRYNHICQIFE